MRYNFKQSGQGQHREKLTFEEGWENRGNSCAAILGEAIKGDSKCKGETQREELS